MAIFGHNRAVLNLISSKLTKHMAVTKLTHSDGRFEEEYQRASSGVAEIVPQTKGQNCRVISIYKESPKPTLCLQEIADSLKIPANVISCCICGVGPGASKKGIYKNPEYYCYHKHSYYEVMNNIHSLRLPQPSNKQGLLQGDCSERK